MKTVVMALLVLAMTATVGTATTIEWDGQSDPFTDERDALVRISNRDETGGGKGTARFVTRIQAPDQVWWYFSSSPTWLPCEEGTLQARVDDFKALEFPVVMNRGWRSVRPLSLPTDDWLREQFKPGRELRLRVVCPDGWPRTEVFTFSLMGFWKAYTEAMAFMEGE